MTEHAVSPAGRTLLGLAMASAGEVLDSTVVGMLCVDERGLFTHIRPGLEVEVLKLLEACDWRGLRRLAEEHSP